MNKLYTDTHETIVARCKHGDKKAFQELYQHYAKAMLNISFRILNNKEEAEDVLQEAFVSAFQHIQTFDGKNTFGSWLKRIVINRSIDVLKKKRIALISIDHQDFPQEETSEETAMEYDIQTVKASLFQLPDGYRSILSLYLFENMGHKEIAELMGISEGTSKSQYHRARKKLIELIHKNTTPHER